ncbi:MAG: hypothetical protein ACFFC1_05615 [Promethearchaeota archaeon]
MKSKWYQIAIRIILVIPFCILVLLLAFVILIGWGKERSKDFLDDYWLGLGR